MIICREKITGFIVEMQSSTKPGTLLSNGANVGRNPDDYEEVEMDEVEYAAIMAIQEPPVINLVQQRRQELLAIGKDNWTAADRDELLEVMAQLSD